MKGAVAKFPKNADIGQECANLVACLCTESALPKLKDLDGAALVEALQKHFPDNEEIQSLCEQIMAHLAERGDEEEDELPELPDLQEKAALRPPKSSLMITKARSRGDSFGDLPDLP